MTHRVVLCHAGDSLRDVWARMKDASLKNLPITDEEGRPIGVLSARDVLRNLLDEAEDEEALLRDYVMGVGFEIGSPEFGHKPVAGLSHYAASEAALKHLTRCWALEFAPHSIRVNAVAAGPTETGALTGMMGLSPEQAAATEEQERERIPLKRRSNPDNVAQWIVWLAEPASEWVTGQVIAFDGGLGLA